MQVQPGAIERLMQMPTETTPSASGTLPTAPRYSPTRAAFLAEASKHLAGSLELEVTARSMSELCLPHLGDACVVCVLSDAHTIGLVATNHRDPLRQAPLAGLESDLEAHNWLPVLSVAHSQEMAILSQVTTILLLADGRPHVALARDLGLRSALLIPVIGSERTLAVVVCLSERARFYTRNHLALAQELASQFAVALEAAEAHHEAQAIRDVGDEERAEALAAAIHDLLSPLTYIKATAQMLRHVERRIDPGTAAELHRRLEGIDLATNRMGAELRRLLDTVRPHPEHSAARTTTCDLVGLVQRVVTEQQAMDSTHALSVVDTTTSVPGRWDVVEVERLLGNLIGNAIKYSPAHTRIDVRVKAEDDDEGRWAVLQVCDRGLGIPAADLPFVFEPFRRGSNVGNVAGTGLGLASVWQIVKVHDGRLWVESEEGQGTRVTVRLPLTSAATSIRN
jgi:signal transduction histidine kinase